MTAPSHRPSPLPFTALHRLSPPFHCLSSMPTHRHQMRHNAIKCCGDPLLPSRIRHPARHTPHRMRFTHAHRTALSHAAPCSGPLGMVRRHWRGVQCGNGRPASATGWLAQQESTHLVAHHPGLSSDTESVRRAAADSAPPPAQAAFRRRQSWQTS